MTMTQEIGERRYGKWAGNPEGHREDITRCITSVLAPDEGWIARQCTRKRGHGPDGLYCVQHAKRAERIERERKP